MIKHPTTRLFFIALATALCATAHAATYLPLQDAELARRSAIVVRAEVIDEDVATADSGGQSLVFTRTRLKALEVLKGAMPEEVFALRTPGGRNGKTGWMVTGRPTFQPGQEVVLFLHPLRDTQDYALSEFALSKFDVLEDAAGTLFLARSTFEPEEERYLSGPDASDQPAGALRELEPFLQSLRHGSRKQASAKTRYSVPTGRLRAPRRGGLAPLWVNLTGREPGECGRTPCLVRWFRDTGDSPMAAIRITGAQTNLSDASNGSSAVTAAVAAWTGVTAAQVPLSGPAGTGNVEVLMDQATHPTGTWTTPIDCGGGVLGVGGPTFQIRPLTFKGDSYFPAQTGSVLMRQNTCPSGYPQNRFAAVFLHESGHVLGLGHPDQGQSTHSTTGPNDWNAAVMRSSLPPAVPLTPQVDDIQGIQYYYSQGGANACVPGLTTLCLAGGRFQVQVTWRNAQGQVGAGNAVSLTADTGYFWFFSASNVEMVVKLLSTCAINQRFWVFAGGLTDVSVTMTVTDTANGTIKVYTNALGTPFQPIQDTNAFATCP
jgi:hypothetical protein